MLDTLAGLVDSTIVTVFDDAVFTTSMLDTLAGLSMSTIRTVFNYAS